MSAEQIAAWFGGVCLLLTTLSSLWSSLHNGKRIQESREARESSDEEKTFKLDNIKSLVNGRFSEMNRELEALKKHIMLQYPPGTPGHDDAQRAVDQAHDASSHDA